MSIQELDYIFPFIVFSYGLIMTLVFYSPLVALAEKKMPGIYWEQFKAHRTLGHLCLIVGALWSLQNLILT